MHKIDSSRTILLVEEDDKARPSLTNHLRQLGYRLLVTAGVEDAFEWISGTNYIHADLVLVNLVDRHPEEALTIARQLRDHSKYDRTIPVVVMPEKVPPDLEGLDKKSNGNEWICYYEDLDQLQNLLARLLKEPN